MDGIKYLDLPPLSIDAVDYCLAECKNGETSFFEAGLRDFGLKDFKAGSVFLGVW